MRYVHESEIARQHHEAMISDLNWRDAYAVLTAISYGAGIYMGIKHRPYWWALCLIGFVCGRVAHHLNNRARWHFEQWRMNRGEKYLKLK
jgi:hypothetical protein